MSFPAPDQSSEKLISDSATNAYGSFENSPNLNSNHTTGLLATAENSTNEATGGAIGASPSPQPQASNQIDVINSHPADETNNIPPGSSISRVYKKCASNGSLAVYVGTRTLTVHGTGLEPLKGVLVFDEESLRQTVSPNFRIWGQITLTFRYGREDEEVLGLRFCNEAILSLRQLWPPIPPLPGHEEEEMSPLQVVLLDRIKASSNSEAIRSVGFALFAGAVGAGAFPPPPSVLLAPAKPYRGSPIGTLYDLRVYASERPEERPPRRNLIRLALRAVQIPNPNLELEPRISMEGCPTILGRGRIKLTVEVDKTAVRYGDSMAVKIIAENNSRSSIRKIIVSLIQQVDVCMFTSGKFKNVVGLMEDTILLVPGASCQKRYELTPTRGPPRQWLALEEAFGRDPILAPTTSTPNEGTETLVETRNSSSSRNVFAIIVSYYVKAKLVLGGIALCQNVKLPFVLLPPLNPDDPDPYPNPKGEIVTAMTNVSTPSTFELRRREEHDRTVLPSTLEQRLLRALDPDIPLERLNLN